MRNIKRLANILWLAFEKGSLVALSAISFFVFALYLTPAELGLAALAIVFCELITRFLCAAIENPLIRCTDNTLRAMSSAFYVGGVFSLLVTFLACILLYLINKESHIWLMLLVLSASVLSSVLSRPFIASLRTQRAFKDLALRTVWGKVLGAASGIFVAIKGGGEWSLITQLIVMNASSFFILLLGDKSFLNTRPSIASFVIILKEGAPIGYRKLLNELFDKSIIILLAIVTTPTMLGYYTFARRLVELPKQAIDTAVMSYAVPVFTSRTNQRELNSLFIQISRSIVFIALPICVFYGVFGSPFIVPLFGEKWAPATIYFLCLALISGVHMFSVLIPPMQAALATSHIGLKAEAVKLLVSLCLAFILGHQFGVMGMIAAIAIDVFALTIIRLSSLSKSMKIELKSFISFFLGLSTITYTLVLACLYVINQYSLEGIQVLVLAPIIAVLYLLMCRLFLSVSISKVIQHFRD